MTEPEITREDIIKQAHPIANRVCRDIAYHYDEYVELDDLVQNLLLWTLEKEDKVRRWLTPTDEDKSCVRGRAALHKTFRNEARRQAIQAQADKLGYSVHDLTFYSNAWMEELLPEALGDCYAEPQRSGGEIRRGGDPAVGGDRLAIMLDVRMAWEKSSDADRDLLRRLYVDPPSPDYDVLDVLAAEAGVSAKTVKRRAERALGRMVWKLGGTKPDFNARARRHK